jgi:ribosomal-protein-alanine N-acetyltransferase
MSDTAKSCAALHADCFISPRPWNEDEFTNLLNDPLTVYCSDAKGFALGRVVVDEAELLTIGVAPDSRGEGRGAHLLNEFLDQCQTRGAETCFLEVAANNATAVSLYQRIGFQEVGRRPKYYAQPKGPAVDAILLSKRLNSA